MGFVVKNTTKCGLLDLLCPHSCRGCGHLGAVLCECCKNDMLEQHQPLCPICKRRFAKSTKTSRNNPNTHVCPDCETPFAGLWAFGYREGALEKLVEQYKYQSLRAAGPVLVDFLDYILPENLGQRRPVVIIPLPTIGRHIRERGLDHTLSIAKRLARRRGWQCRQLLTRAVDTVQVGAKASARKTQAAKAYAVPGKISPDAAYLLLDDVWTTGSTLLAAEKVLRAAGAKHIYATVLAVSK